MFIFNFLTKALNLSCFFRTPIIYGIISRDELVSSLLLDHCALGAKDGEIIWGGAHFIIPPWPTIWNELQSSLGPGVGSGEHGLRSLVFSHVRANVSADLCLCVCVSMFSLLWQSIKVKYILPFSFSTTGLLVLLDTNVLGLFHFMKLEISGCGGID